MSAAQDVVGVVEELPATAKPVTYDPVHEPREIMERALGGPSEKATLAVNAILLALDLKNWRFCSPARPGEVIRYAPGQRAVQDERP